MKCSPTHDSRAAEALLLTVLVASAHLLNQSCLKIPQVWLHKDASHVTGSRAMLMQWWLNAFKLLDLEETSQQGLLKQTST